MLVKRNRGDRLGVLCLGVKGAALAALGEIVVLRAPFGAVDRGLNEGESTFNRLALEQFMSHYFHVIQLQSSMESTNLFSMDWFGLVFRLFTS
jgi:hypothetical protein